MGNCCDGVGIPISGRGRPMRGESPMVAACSLREDEHMEHNTRATKSRQLSKHTPFVGIATVVVMWGYWISFDLDDDWMFYFVMGSTAAAALFLLARGLPGLAAVGLLSAVAAAPLVAIMLPPVTLMALITGPFVFGAALGELMTYPARVWLPVVAVAAIGFVAGDLVGVGATTTAAGPRGPFPIRRAVPPGRTTVWSSPSSPTNPNVLQIRASRESTCLPPTTAPISPASETTDNSEPAGCRSSDLCGASSSDTQSVRKRSQTAHGSVRSVGHDVWSVGLVDGFESGGQHQVTGRVGRGRVRGG